MQTDDQDMTPITNGEEPEEDLPSSSGSQRTGQPEKSGSSSLDLSGGAIKRGIFGSKTHFEAGVKKQLREIGSILNVSQRRLVAEDLAKMRHRGLTPNEVRDHLEKLKKDNKLSPLEVKKIRSKLGVKKKSSWFW